MEGVPLYERTEASTKCFLGSSALVSDALDALRATEASGTVSMGSDADPTDVLESEEDFIAFLEEDTEAIRDAEEVEEKEVVVEEEEWKKERFPPWRIPPMTITSPWLRLHEEVIAFGRFVAPTEEEKVAREEAVERVKSVVQFIWKRAQLQVFGSFATGLYLPTSDIDAVILNSGCREVQDGLRALANALSRRGMVKNMQIISKARVPIIKFQEKESGHQFDISFDVANGPQAAHFLNKWLNEIPQVRPLCLVLKFFLQQRELNEVYTGGIGSYALLTMIVAFLKTHPSRRNRLGNRKSLDGNLGLLLVDFFRLYGKLLNRRDVGITANEGGMFYSKREKNFHNPARAYLLSIQDPVDATNDLGKNSYNISKVSSAFDFAFQKLTAPSIVGAPSILEGILDWRRDSLLIERARAVRASVYTVDTHKREHSDQDTRDTEAGRESGKQQRKRKRKRPDAEKLHKKPKNERGR